MTLLAIGVSHRTAGIALRERLGLTERAAVELLGTLIAQPEIAEVAVLATCNRTELYLLAADGRAEAATHAATAALAAVAGMPAEELAPALRMRQGLGTARHLFRVTAGLESMVLGETEIQGQVARAYSLALSQGTGGRIVHRLFQDALCTGKRVRAETGVSRRGASVASVAVELARRELGGLEGRRALVIGAGKHGGLAAAALAGAGVRTVFVANRARERAEALAARFGGAAVPFDRLADELAQSDLVLTCTSCPQRILGRAELAAAARGRRLVVLDTAMPRDVDPAARDVAGVTLYDLEAVEREIAGNLSARAADAREAEPIVEAELARFGRWVATLDVAPTIAALRERGLAAVDRALRDHERRSPPLTEDDRRRVERVARAVVSDLLHEPTLGLRRASERGASAHYAQTVRELFGLSA